MENHSVFGEYEEDAEFLDSISRFSDEDLLSGRAAEIMRQEADEKTKRQALPPSIPSGPSKPSPFEISNPSFAPKPPLATTFAFKRNVIASGAASKASSSSKPYPVPSTAAKPLRPVPLAHPPPPSPPPTRTESPKQSLFSQMFTNQKPAEKTKKIKLEGPRTTSVAATITASAASVFTIKKECDFGVGNKQRCEPLASASASEAAPSPRIQQDRKPLASSSSSSSSSLSEQQQLYVGPIFEDGLDEEDALLDDHQTEILAASEEGHNIFITGPAGTGKSRVIKAIVKRLTRLEKVVYQVAHNGVAAANVSGMTVHSYAGISGSDRPPYKPNNPDARVRIAMTDVLIIDEISTIDNHMLPGLDLLFRTVRCKMDIPFGGMQIIACGDFAQLKPIDSKKKREIEEQAKAEARKDYAQQPGVTWGNDKSREWLKYKHILTNPEEKTDFCFLSKAWKLVARKAFILDRIYRQTDARFLKILNEIRDGTLSAESKAVLEGRMLCHRADLMLEDGTLSPEYTTLYSRRADVELHNSRMLDGITTDCGYTYNSIDRSIAKLAFLVKQFPVGEKIWLKVGARVMLKKNITRSMVNGLCGTVIGFAEIFAKQRSSPLFRPIEGCVIGHATAAITNEPLTRDYSVPVGKAVPVPDGCKSGSFCPRKILSTLPPSGLKRDRAELGTEDPDLTDYELATEQRIRALKSSGFYPLPVVHFENGEVTVVMPLEWSIEDQRKVSKKKQLQQQQQSGPEDSGPERLKLASRVQIPLIHAWAISVHMSQGLTIAKLCVDLGSKIFEEGQAYVAISRGQSLEGLVVRDLDVSKIKASQTVKGFYRALHRVFGTGAAAAAATASDAADVNYDESNFAGAANANLPVTESTEPEACDFLDFSLYVDADQER